MKTFVALALLLAPIALFAAEEEKICPPNYSYCGWAGVQQWKNLPGATCYGPVQSPVNVAKWTTKRGGPAITVNYGEVAAEVINTGHDIEVKPKTGGGTITVDGTTYNLVQFHFHTPSEHQLSGKTFPAEVHFVHELGDKLAVIAVLIDVERSNRALAPIFAGLPEKICTSKPVKLDLKKLLPAKIVSYFTYPGSLTTPPCSEGVTFYIANGTGITISAPELAKLKRLGANARPVQNIGKRTITLVKPTR